MRLGVLLLGTVQDKAAVQQHTQQGEPCAARMAAQLAAPRCAWCQLEAGQQGVRRGERMRYAANGVK